MPVAATGVQGEALEKLVELVANAPEFQRRLNVGDWVAAEKHIHYPWLESNLDEVEGSRPAAIIELGDFAWSQFAGGAQNYLEDSGSLSLTLTDNDRHIGDSKGSVKDFLNFCDDVIEYLAAHSAISENLTIVSIRQTQVPRRSPPESTQQYWSAMYEISYGAASE